MSGKGMNLSFEDEVLLETFNLFDKDGSGTISTNEFGTVVRAIGFNPSDDEIEQTIKEFDLDRSGRLDFGEFKRYVEDYKKKHKNSQEAILNAFKVFDKDGNGYIETKELKSILTKCGQVLQDSEVEAMIEVADVDKDGKINYSEFAKFICQPIK